MRSLSQEMKLLPAIGLGIATGQMRSTFFLARGLRLGPEKSIGKPGVLSVSIGRSSAQKTYPDTAGVHVFANCNSLNIPVAFRKCNPLSPRSSCLIEWGSAPTFHLGERRAIRAGGEVCVERCPVTMRCDPIVSGIGYKRTVEGTTSIRIGFHNNLYHVKMDKQSQQKFRQNEPVLAPAFFRKLTQKLNQESLKPDKETLFSLLLWCGEQASVQGLVAPVDEAVSLNLSEDKVYIFSRGTRSKASLLAKRCDVTDTSSTPGGVRLYADPRFFIDNVIDEVQKGRSALVVHALDFLLQ